MEWKEVRLGDIATMQYGKLAPKKKDAGNVPIFTGYKNVGYTDKINCNKNTIVVVARGVGGCGDVKITNEDCYLTNLAISVSLNAQICVPMFFYYLHQLENLSILNSGSAQPQITIESLTKYSFRIPSLDDQHRIASILSSLDRKIELNNKINADLEEMAQAIFKNWFVDFEPFKDGKFVDSELGMIPEGWKVGRADDFYQINIGKTPPRKEHKWFSTNPADKIWVSIANMGNSGIFISDSSEYLTKEAVDRHNIIMVPRNTILLSFKLTVGRVAIADKELTTNEAIARFILSDDKYMEYLYLYLKNFDYNSLGSTSSIATAVNSKTIKGMQMLQPSDKIIDAFHIQVNPIFEKIRSLTKENSRLSLLRDTLLPRLMSGELEVPE